MKLILNDTFKDCRNKNFHSFEYRGVHDIEITNMENNEEVVLTITIGYMKFYRLNKKIENALKNGFSFSEILKITIKTDSSISNVNISHYSKFPIPIIHREIFRIISQNRKYEMIEIILFITLVENGI